MQNILTLHVKKRLHTQKRTHAPPHMAFSVPRRNINIRGVEKEEEEKEKKDKVNLKTHATARGMGKKMKFWPLKLALYCKSQILPS